MMQVDLSFYGQFHQTATLFVHLVKTAWIFASQLSVISLLLAPILCVSEYWQDVPSVTRKLSAAIR
jgi:hypothetical protein